MNCRRDFATEDDLELESIRVCKYLIYLYEMVGHSVPEWIRVTANDYYGNTNRVSEATRMLCECIRNLSTGEFDLLVNGDTREALRIWYWWENHKEWDRCRVKREIETRARVHAKLNRKDSNNAMFM